MGAVMLVEDDEDIRVDLAEALRTEGYQVRTACHGADALDQLRASGDLPCLILLDLMMPVMDGWEFCDAQRRDQALAGIPVVLLSGADNLAAKAAGLRIANFILKPFRLHQILDAVRRFCPDGVRH